MSIRSVAKQERMSRNTIRKMLAFDEPPRRRTAPRREDPKTREAPRCRRDTVKQQWLLWLYDIEREDSPVGSLQAAMVGCSAAIRRRVLAVRAIREGFSLNSVAEYLGMSRNTVRWARDQYERGGVTALLQHKPRTRMADDDELRSALFALLHEPPSLSGFNRTTWRMADLRTTLEARGFPACTSVIREAIKKSGFRWRAAKVVLTSNDPLFREKLDRVQSVLSNLGDDERFFSIDEFGPFAVKAKPGRSLVAPGDHPAVPQWQRSRGCLILTAALELSRNQITHFYSRAKNTTEMIKMAEALLAEHSAARTLYLSWDAASWHVSKSLLDFVEANNSAAAKKPRIELVPLPASAQFLNVIESIFSGMARAIIHKSDYATVDDARSAIDRYFAERNAYFQAHPKRAGKWIWGLERTPPQFAAGNNCKDPAYR
jgi:transposase